MTKHALLVGINYFGQDGELAGCINDVINIKDMLISKFGYSADNIIMLTDDQEEESKKPTATNIIQNLYNLISKTHSDTEEIWFHYSGHGYYIRDRSGDEEDGMDECLCPVDYQESGLIRDDDLRNIVKYIDSTCRGIFIMDCCHSGTILDLKYQYVGKNENKIANNTSLAIDAPVIMISGCRDDQTSADAYINSENQGAMTHALLFALKKRKYSVTCFSLLKLMRKYLYYNDYTQIPQMSSSRQINNVSVFCSQGEVDQFVSM